MKKNSVCKLISLLIAVVFAVSVFAGCFGGNENIDDEPTNNDIAPENIPAIGGLTAKSDNKFTLRYTADEPLNPLRCESMYNDAVASLIYDGLFRLDEQFRPVPVLCSDYTTTNGST